jgi:hypothetical protein
MAAHLRESQLLYATIAVEIRAEVREGRIVWPPLAEGRSIAAR